MLPCYDILQNNYLVIPTEFFSIIIKRNQQISPSQVSHFRRTVQLQNVRRITGLYRHANGIFLIFLAANFQFYIRMFSIERLYKQAIDLTVDIAAGLINSGDFGRSDRNG